VTAFSQQRAACRAQMLCGMMPATDVDGKTRDPAYYREDALATVRFWLNSIAVHTSQRGDASLPPILLVGTHGDQVSQLSFGAQAPVRDCLPRYTCLLPITAEIKELQPDYGLITGFTAPLLHHYFHLLLIISISQRVSAALLFHYVLIA
jgi:hypothetical protein